MVARRLTITQQRERTAALDAIRLQRPLTTQEQAEADSLTHRAYMREWRAQQAERRGGRRRAR